MPHLGITYGHPWPSGCHRLEALFAVLLHTRASRNALLASVCLFFFLLSSLVLMLSPDPLPSNQVYKATSHVSTQISLNLLAGIALLCCLSLAASCPGGKRQPWSPLTPLYLPPTQPIGRMPRRSLPLERDRSDPNSPAMLAEPVRSRYSNPHPLPHHRRRPSMPG
jgi:hypothetical protein